MHINRANNQCTIWGRNTVCACVRRWQNTCCEIHSSTRPRRRRCAQAGVCVFWLSACAAAFIYYICLLEQHTHKLTPLFLPRKSETTHTRSHTTTALYPDLSPQKQIMKIALHASSSPFAAAAADAATQLLVGGLGVLDVPFKNITHTFAQACYLFYL